VKWFASNWRYIVMVLAAIDVVGNALVKYLETGGKPDVNGLLLVAGTALFAWLKTAPGDVTKTQAKQLAHDHASEVLRSVSMSPPPPKNGD
jgi:hypothetical protein